MSRRAKRTGGFALCLLAVTALAAARAETMEQLYEKAKQEKSLLLYSGAGPAAAKNAGEAFKKRFPGITVTAKGDFSNVLDQEVDRQLKDKKITVDVMQFQTVQDFRRWDKAGQILRFKPDGSEQIYAAMKDKNGAWIAVNSVPLFYGYNPEKVSEADVPKSALDFLKPQFRGKLVTAYPNDDDATLYDFELIARKYGAGYMKKYLANQPTFVQGHRDVAARIRQGTDYVSFDMSNSSMGAGPNAGGPLRVVMSAKDKTPVFFTAVAIPKAAPHPNAAKLFVTWMISKEQQGRNKLLYSPRRDVPPPAGLPPFTDQRFAMGYAAFVGDGKKLAAIRKRYDKLVGPVVNKSTVP